MKNTCIENPFPFIYIVYLMKLTTNPLPALQAALLAEQGPYRPEEIGIHPADGAPGVSLREILEVKPGKKDGTLTIRVNSKAPERLALEQWLETREKGRESQGSDDFRTLLAVFERETTLFRIETMLRERNHLLGLSHLQPAFFPEAGRWDAEQRRTLAFFLPYGSQIRGDKVLMEKCLGAALEEMVRVWPVAPQKLIAESAQAGICILDGDARAGGQLQSARPCLEIAIGPVAPEKWTDYVPGGRQQRFLEEALLPLFAGPDTDWKIQVVVEPEFRKFRITGIDRPLYMDINSFVE